MNSKMFALVTILKGGIGTIACCVWGHNEGVSKYVLTVVMLYWLHNEISKNETTIHQLNIIIYTLL